MATLYISEYADLYIHQGSALQAPKDPPLAEQTVTIGASSAQSSVFNAKTRIIRVATDAICSVLIGANPTATVAKARMVAGQAEYRAVNPGDKIAVIVNT